jgi:RNA polymerase sigma factor (sigma-70 family)
MTSSTAIDRLADSRERFLAYAQRRIADPELAEDIVQTSLTRAAEGFDKLRSEESLIPWFYAILRNAITDAYRRQASAREVALPPDLDVEDENERAAVCECFLTLLASLKPEYADLIERIDLRGEPSETAAARLGITPNNLKVRHHRARQALRRRLEETCRVCSEHHCLDCTCNGTPTTISR